MFRHRVKIFAIIKTFISLHVENVPLPQGARVKHSLFFGFTTYEKSGRGLIFYKASLFFTRF